MFCRKCGQKLPDNTKFCTKCGAPTIVVEAQQQTTAQNQPIMNKPYQVMIPQKKKFPIWAIVLIVIVSVIIAFVAIFIAGNAIYSNDVATIREMIQNEDFDSAENKLNELLDTNDSIPDTYIVASEFYLAKGDYKSALSILNKGIDKLYDNAELLQKKDEISKEYSYQIAEDEKAEEAAKKKAEEEAKKKAEEEVKRKEEEEKQQEQKSKKDMQDYIQSCKSVPYKDLLRNPDSYKGQKIKITVEIQQIMSGGIFTDGGFRGYEDYDISAGDTFLQKEWYINGSVSDSGTKILKDDIVVFYGEFAGTETIKRALTGVKEEVPCIDFKYYSIENQ